MKFSTEDGNRKSGETYDICVCAEIPPTEEKIIRETFGDL
jgi:hypothetical protein